MNIVYLLTNLNKAGGRRFYIGSKVECKLIDIDGIPTIYNVKTSKPYYSSSSCPGMRADLEQGHVLSATVLEVVIGRDNLRERENHYMRLHDAVASGEYYNMSEAFQNTYDHNAIKNVFGETIAEYASSCSSCSKRDNTAVELGFGNFGEMYFAFQDRLDSGEMTKDIAESYGKHRKWVQVSLREFDMDKAKTDLASAKQEEVRDLLTRGASLKKAAELLGIEIPTARVLLGDFSKDLEKQFSVARSRGKSKEEFEIEITQRILAGEEILDISNSTALCRESVLRYFMRCVRRCVTPDMIT